MTTRETWADHAWMQCCYTVGGPKLRLPPDPCPAAPPPVEPCEGEDEDGEEDEE